MAKKQKIGVVGTILTIAYPAIGKKFVTDVSKYPEAMKFEFFMHGAKQKFGDAESGKSAAEKYAMVQRMHDGILAGNWELTGTPDLTPIILESIARIKGVPLASVEKAADIARKAALKADPESEDPVKGWGRNDQVRAEILKIRSERAAKIVEESDAEELEIPGLK